MNTPLSFRRGFRRRNITRACLALVLFLSQATLHAQAAPDAIQPPDATLEPVPEPAPTAVATAPDIKPVPARTVLVTASQVAADGSQWPMNMDSLRVVHRSATQSRVAQQVVLNVFLLALGTANFQGFSKEEFSGVEPADVQDKDRIRSPIAVLLPSLQTQANEWLSKTGSSRPLRLEKPLVVGAHSWRLIYDELASSDDTYRLTFDAGIYKVLDRRSFFKGARTPGKRCTWASEPRKLDEWKANDYQAVADLAPGAAAKCAEEFVAQLPDLLGSK